jgi:hypothetical protein
MEDGDRNLGAVIFISVCGSRARIGMQWGEKGPCSVWDPTLARSIPAFRRCEPTFGLLIWQRVLDCWERRTCSVQFPPASLRSARVLTDLYSAFSNPVLERLRYGMANMRLARRGPIATTVSLLANKRHGLAAAEIRCSHCVATQIEELIWPASTREFGVHASAINESLRCPIGLNEMRRILHELVAAAHVYSRLVGKQDREWNVSLC